MTPPPHKDHTDMNLAHRSAENHRVGSISIQAWQLEDRAEQRMSLSHMSESISGRVGHRGGHRGGTGGQRGSDASCLQTVLPVDASLTESMTVRMKYASLCSDTLLHSGTAGKHRCFHTTHTQFRREQKTHNTGS